MPPVGYGNIYDVSFSDENTGVILAQKDLDNIVATHSLLPSLSQTVFVVIFQL